MLSKVDNYISSYVTVDSANAAKLTSNDENAGVDTISSDNLLAEFGLGLVVGKVERDQFVQLTGNDEVDVGQVVRVMLTNKETAYRFVVNLFCLFYTRI